MSKKILLLTFILLSFSFAKEASFSQAGDKWLGIELNFNSLRALGGTGSFNTLNISSVTRFFPADNFIIGPSFAYSRLSFGESGDREAYNIYDMGLDIGFSGNIKNKVMPYFILNPVFSLFTERYEGEGYGEPSFVGNCEFGTNIFINENVGIQLEPMYTIMPLEELHFWSFNFGLTFNLNKNLFSISKSSKNYLDLLLL